MNCRTFVRYNGIFGGGGVKGIAYVGALIALEKNGFIIDKAGGTSVGAIIAGLIVAGYTSVDLLYILEKINFKEFDQLFSIKKVGNYVKNKGLVSSNKIYQFLKPYFLRKNIWYYQDIMENGKSKLKVSVTKLNNPLSKKPTLEEVIIPDDLENQNINKYTFPIVDSIVMSSAFPFYFTPYEINNKLYIDGGIKGKINLNLFNDEPNIKIAFCLKKNPKEIVKQIFGGYMIMIDTKDVTTFDFKLTSKDKKKLFESGYQSALYLVNWLSMQS